MPTQIRMSPHISSQLSEYMIIYRNPVYGIVVNHFRRNNSHIDVIQLRTNFLV